MDINDLLQMLPQLQVPQAPATPAPAPAGLNPRLRQAYIAGMVPPQPPAAAPAMPAPVPTTPTAAPPPTAAPAAPQDQSTISKLMPYALPLLVGLASAASPVAARGVTAGANTLLAAQQMQMLNQRQRLADARAQETALYHRAMIEKGEGPKIEKSGDDIISVVPKTGEAKVVYKGGTPRIKDLSGPMRDALVTMGGIDLNKKLADLTPEEMNRLKGARNQLIQEGREAAALGAQTGKLQANINVTGMPYNPKAPTGGGKGGGGGGLYIDVETGLPHKNDAGEEVPTGTKANKPWPGEKNINPKDWEKAADTYATHQTASDALSNPAKYSKLSVTEKNKNYQDHKDTYKKMNPLPAKGGKAGGGAAPAPQAAPKKLVYDAATGTFKEGQ